MKTNKLIIIICCIMLAAFLLGTAGVINVHNKAAEENQGTDRLIGVLITREYLDLFDSDRYFAENTGKSGEISEADMEKYGGRLFAKQADKAQNTDEKGNPIMTKDYIFEGVEGIRFFSPLVQDGGAPYLTTITDNTITDISQGFHTSDTEEKRTCSGTIYVAARGNEANFYFNPVYETPDGEVYALSGDGMFLGSELTTGTSLSQTMNETHTETTDGKALSFSTEVQVSFCVIEEPLRTAVLLFDADDTLLSRTEYLPEAFPDHIDTAPGTAYIIVESASADGLSRDLYQQSDKYLAAFSPTENGLCVKRSSEIHWAE